MESNEMMSQISNTEAAPMKSKQYGHLNKTFLMQHQLTCQCGWREHKFVAYVRSYR